MWSPFLDSPYFSTLLGATYCFYVGDIPTRNCLKQLAAAKIGKTENLLLKPSHQLRILSLGQQIRSVQVMCVTIRHKMKPQNLIKISVSLVPSSGVEALIGCIWRYHKQLRISKIGFEVTASPQRGSVGLWPVQTVTMSKHWRSSRARPRWTPSVAGCLRWSFHIWNWLVSLRAPTIKKVIISLGSKSLQGNHSNFQENLQLGIINQLMILYVHIYTQLKDEKWWNMTHPDDVAKMGTGFMFWTPGLVPQLFSGSGFSSHVHLRLILNGFWGSGGSMGAIFRNLGWNMLEPIWHSYPTEDSGRVSTEHEWHYITKTATTPFRSFPCSDFAPESAAETGCPSWRHLEKRF